MHLPTTLVTLALATLAPTISTAQHTPQSQCAKGIHIIANAGKGANDEGRGYGGLRSLKNKILAAIPGSTQHLCTYPSGPVLPQNVAAGQETTTKAIQQYVRSCPQTPVVLIGYSEGAVINTDTLCGDSSPGFIPTEGIDTKYTKNIIAVASYGDETRAALQPYNRGTCDNTPQEDTTISPGGIFVRANPLACQPWAKKIVSYCDFLDPLCCAPGTNKTVHFLYPKVYDEAATKFVVRKWRQHKRNKAA